MRYRINLLPDHHRVTFQFVLINLLNKALLALMICAIFLAASTVFAADIRPMGGLDAQATGSVVPAKSMNSGGVALGLGIHSADKTNVADQLNHASALVGFGLSQSLSLNVGVQGTQENNHESEFAGATVLAKWTALSHGGMNLSLAPFVESGVGSQADQSLSRSSGVKGGWMVLTGWEDRHIGALDINLGYRYRNPENLGDLILRNEMFVQAAIKAYLVDGFGLMAGAQGRRVMIAKANSEDVKKKYSPVDAGEMQAGLVLDIGSMSVAVFGGQKVKGAGLGNGEKHVGASLAYVIGDKAERAAGRTKVADKKSKKDDVVAAPAAPVKDPNGIYDLDGSEIDPYADFDKEFGESEDFKSVRENIRRDNERMKQNPISEDARVENELRQIKDAEAKQEAAEKARQAAEMDEKRARSRAEREAQADELRRLKGEVKQDVDQFGNISDEALNWEGLEEQAE